MKGLAWLPHFSIKNEEHVKCNLCGCDNSKLLAVINTCNVVRCRNCGLVYINPQPSLSELADLYTFSKNYYVDAVQRISTIQDNQVFDDSRLNIVIRYKNSGRILEIGCGTGSFLRAAKGEGWEVFGIELSEDLAEFARRKLGLNIITGVLEKTSFPDQYFDVITMWDVLEHVKDPFETLSRVNRLLKDDGFLFISTPNIDSLEPRLTYYLMAKTIGFWRHPEPPYHLYQFSRDSIRKLLDKVAFHIVELQLAEQDIEYIAPLRKSVAPILVRVLFRIVYEVIYLVVRIINRGPVGNHMTIIAKKKVPTPAFSGSNDEGA